MGQISYFFKRHIYHKTQILNYTQKSTQHGIMGDSPTSRANGVAIGLSIDVRIVLVDRLVDPKGRYLILRGNLQEMECTLANVYCPNRSPENYLKEILNKLTNFKRGSTVLAGDFNFCLDPRMDSMSNAPRTNSL